uniref:Transient receptor potential cation channel subfamily V member 5-like n=1 Tax=Neolamprologus brichardi TaxID=32507 RepID=A0A3Q4GRX5_NEOBR
KASFSGFQVEVKYCGLAEDDEDDKEQRDQIDNINKNQQLNKKLLDHFRHLVDLQLLDRALSDGADPNALDRYGQTVLHEISRAWSVDVMRFFLDRGSDLLRPDQFGVTALHVASALDYQDMVQFLLDRKADPEARTFLDKQTPLHYAAKNDAVGSIRLLLQAGASIGCTDYKRRTPLQLAANRSDAARVLLELGAEAGLKDSDGQFCITALIGRMSPVAQLALSQFHVFDRMTRQHYYYLNLLEPELHSPEDQLSGDTTVCSLAYSSLTMVIQEEKLDLIMNPVFLKLIHVKWNLYGHFSTCMSVCPADRFGDWWRVLFVVLALLLTLQEVLRDVRDILRSRKKLHLWQQLAKHRLQSDLSCSHPMWPQFKLVDRKRGSYCRDLWNVFDWLVYFLLTASFSVHVADVIGPSTLLNTISLRMFSITIVFLWLRLMKHVRGFRLMGPFIVMLGKIVGDVMRFLFLYAEIFIPYACSFWIMFGGMASVPSMQSVLGLLYSLYRITLVDEYEYAAMVAVDDVMAPVLCGTFLAASSILCVNLLIALLTDTFQRVHDNSQAVAMMQQAAVILHVEESMPLMRHFYDNQYISSHCSPLVEPSDDGNTTNLHYHDEMGRITVQIKDNKDKCSQILQKQNQELQALRAELKELQTLVLQLVKTKTNSV